MARCLQLFNHPVKQVDVRRVGQVEPDAHRVDSLRAGET
jgi:hypothetical protein